MLTLMLIKSQLPNCQWPAIPNDAGAQALAMQYQLENSQWLPPAQMAQAQFGQLQLLLEDAFRNIPHWRDALEHIGFRPGTPIGGDAFSTLPVLRRSDIQALGDNLFNRGLQRAHGDVVQAQTSGSTGEPVKFYQTDVTQHFWRALALREHLWQRRDFSGKLAIIRSNIERGTAQNWGTATEHVVQTGPGCSLNIRADIDEQLAWLSTENPDYLLTHPSNLKALTARAIDRAIALPRLRQQRTFGEILAADTIALCRRAWNAGIADTYSSEEAGYIASQCERGSYHIQSENLLVEVVDAGGNACGPGQTGRVLITTLHNFAMPLFRYEIGDYAEPGEPCACGRGLPVLRRILGRRRNMLLLPDGTQHWPSFPEDRWADIAPIQQLQAVQKALDEIVLRIRAQRPLTADESAQLIATFKDTLKFPHRISIEHVATIARTANAKFEDFVSEIA